MIRGEVAHLAKIAYATTARSIGRGLGRSGLLPKIPPERAHRVRHWAYSLTCVHDSAALAELDVPWWTYRAIDVVQSWLSARAHPVRVFEYGSGASTVWLSRRVDEVYSVEHDHAFAAPLAPFIGTVRNVRLETVAAVRSAHPVVPSAKEGHRGLDYADYVASIDRVEGEFDLIVVDGRAREACLLRALPRLRADGIIVFDNSRRRRYRRAIAAADVTERRLRGLTPTLPYPDQTSLLTPRHARS